MRCSSSLLALAAVTIGQAAAAILNHRHFHARSSPNLEIAESSALPKRSVLAASDASALVALGFAGAGINAVAPNGGAWLGADGTYTTDFQNNSTEQVVLTIWTGATSWVNKFQPAITVSLPPGSIQTVSFADGVSGGWAGIYPTTTLVNGQVSNTWGEFTFSGIYSTIDVSREVNMDGRGLRIETPTCVTDMNTCVFVCKDGASTCWLDYELQNCAPGSQPGAASGMSYGAPSGGCSGIGTSAKIKAFFY